MLSDCWSKDILVFRLFISSLFDPTQLNNLLWSPSLRLKPQMIEENVHLQNKALVDSFHDLIITTPKLRSSVWEYFRLNSVDGKITNKEKAVFRVCKKQLNYFTTTTNLSTQQLAATQVREWSNVNCTASSDCLLLSTLLLRTLAEACKRAISDKISRFV